MLLILIICRNLQISSFSVESSVLPWHGFHLVKQIHFYLISNLEPDCKKVQMRYELDYGSCHKKLVIEYKEEPLSSSIKHWVLFASDHYHLVTNYILDYHERIPHTYTTWLVTRPLTCTSIFLSTTVRRLSFRYYVSILSWSHHLVQYITWPSLISHDYLSHNMFLQETPSLTST